MRKAPLVKYTIPLSRTVIKVLKRRAKMFNSTPRKYAREILTYVLVRDMDIRTQR